MDVRNGAVAGRMRRAERGVGAPARPTPRMGHESALGGRSKPSRREISVNDAFSRSADQPLWAAWAMARRRPRDGVSRPAAAPSATPSVAATVAIPSGRRAVESGLPAVMGAAAAWVVDTGAVAAAAPASLRGVPVTRPPRSLCPVRCTRLLAAACSEYAWANRSREVYQSLN